MPPSEIKIDKLTTLVIDRRHATPMHRQVERSLREIIALDFADGDAFFTEAQLVEKLGVSRPTVRHALAELTRDGLLLRRASVGTVVVKAPPPAPPTQTRHVGVLLADSESEYASMLLQQIIVACRRDGFDLHVYSVHRGESAAQAVCQILRSPDEERLIVVNAYPVLDWLTAQGYSVVSIEATHRDQNSGVVETDARMAVQIGVDYLRTLGHRRITLLVNEPAAVLSVRDKIEQFRDALPEGRVVICGTQVWDNSYQTAYAHMGEAWQADSEARPTAIMTVSDPGAWAALRWLAERGVAVPGDISVLGFEDVRSSRFMHPSLSTIAHPVEELARTALAMLWDDDGGPRHRRLAPSLVIRESTGPAPGA